MSFLFRDPARTPPGRLAGRVGRRAFLGRAAAGLAGLSAMDFLGYFARYGLAVRGPRLRAWPRTSPREEEPSFLIYWFLEGGWEGYDMFNPVVTPNNVIDRLENPSDERYRVLKFGEEGYRIRQHGNIRYGYLAEKGQAPLPRDGRAQLDAHRQLPLGRAADGPHGQLQPPPDRRTARTTSGA